MSKSDVERITITRDPESGRRRFECPYCNQALPTNDLTECDVCGAHLELLVRTCIPPTFTDDDAEDEEDE